MFLMIYQEQEPLGASIIQDQVQIFWLFFFSFTLFILFDFHINGGLQDLVEATCALDQMIESQDLIMSVYISES